jgi:hypothetical protein
VLQFSISHVPHFVSSSCRFVDSTRRWEFEDAPLANYVNFQLTAAGSNDMFARCCARLQQPLIVSAVAAIVGSDIAPTCVAAECKSAQTAPAQLARIEKLDFSLNNF